MSKREGIHWGDKLSEKLFKTNLFESERFFIIEHQFLLLIRNARSQDSKIHGFPSCLPLFHLHLLVQVDSWSTKCHYFYLFILQTRSYTGKTHKSDTNWNLLLYVGLWLDSKPQKRGKVMKKRREKEVRANRKNIKYGTDLKA